MVLAVLCATGPGYDTGAQTFLPTDDLPTVTRSGGEILNAFAGGTEAPIMQLVDLDADGDLDLALSDRDNVLRLFERTASGPGMWTSKRDPEAGITIQSWFRFADLDGDGDLDLFTGGQSAGVIELKNVGSAQSMLLDPRGIPLLDINGSPVLNEVVNVPAFADPDGDGDLDFFSGNSAGSIGYYQNIGSPTEPSFRFMTDTYQGVTIIGFGGATLDSTRTRVLHGAMGIAFGDLDTDGDLDILWGDFFSPSLYFLQNSGSPTNPHYVLVDSTFPDAFPSISSGFNVPSLGDVDGDGDLDMLVAVASGFQSKQNLFFFRNVSGGGMADLRLESSDPLSTLDIGSMTRPAVGDVSGDGLPDIVLGEGGGIIRLLRQVQHPTGVSFDLEPDTLLFLPGIFYLDPAVCDLDGDGSNEIMLGDFTGRLRLYRRGTAWTEDTTFQLRSMTLGQSISPAVADLDGDGDQDLVIGHGNGRLTYYENTGSSAAPAFVNRPGLLDAIDVGEDAVPLLYDLTSDGLPDLVVGSRNEGISVWVQYSGLYVPYPYAFRGEQRSANTAPAVLAASGGSYLFLGNRKGGLEVLRQTGEHIRSLAHSSVDQPYPNPASTVVTIRFDLPVRGHVTITVVDILGRAVLRVRDGEKGPGYLSESFSVRELSSGVYHVRVLAGGRKTFPIVVVR